MLFTSWQYLAFLALICAFYYLLPQKLRWVLLLAASYYFYMQWNAPLVLLIMASTLVSYGAALLISRTQSTALRRLFLWLGAGFHLAALFYFKYFNFFARNLSTALRLAGISGLSFERDILLPVGISFYTFQTLSYIVDVYRGKYPAQRHLGHYALYVSFFPQLVAGPIERAGNLLGQLRAPHTARPENFSCGLRMICWGFVKKVWLADVLARYADSIFSEAALGNFTPMGALLAAVMFAFQLYCDFSAYSDIAIGSALLLDIRLTENFRAPFFARSTRELWRRWHITLSSWLTDYVYIPLGGSRVSLPRHIFNLLFTFLLSGLWHGANWSFVFWGLWNGTLIVLDLAVIPSRERLERRLPVYPRRALQALETAVTFALFCAGMLFFRTQSLRLGAIMLAAVPGAFVHPALQFREALTALGLWATPQGNWLAVCLAALLIHDFLHWRTEREPWTLLSRCRAPLRAVLSYAVAAAALAALLMQPDGVAVEFIYFQF
ncbi:MAG: MBOAT family protein [Subdoligranulum sp.]|nr:MBOAT family protein [Subdoligranulum sp.]